MNQPRHISARVSVLDKQIVDADRLPIGRVDDLELSMSAADGPPQVEALLTGAEALGQRLGGLTGNLMAAAAARLRTGSLDGPREVDPALVSELEPMIRLSLPLADLPEVAALERWLGQRLERVPGAGRAIE